MARADGRHGERKGETMETRASHLLVGSFVLVLMAGVVVFTLWLTKVQLDRKTDTYAILFAGSVTGLHVGGPVRYAGLPVGNVTDMRIDPDDAGLVRVVVDLDAGTPIKEDSLASLEIQGLTGVAYVQISAGSRDSKPLTGKDGALPVIPSRPSTLAEVFRTVPRVMTQATELAEKLTLLLSPENMEHIGATLANVRAMTADLKEASAGAGGAMRELEALTVEARGYARDLGDSAGDALNQARTTLAHLDQDAQSLTGEVKELTRSLKKTSDQLGGVLSDARDPLRDFSRGGLYDLTALVAEMRELTAGLSRIINRLERDPASFLFNGTRRGEPVK